MTTTRPAPMRLADSIANQLEQRILEGSLKPGDRLPPERDFAIELGVSRPSLREAMQKLVSKGLLSTRHGGGTFVTDRLEAYFVDPWQEMLKNQPFLHRDLLEFRQMLENQAATLAAERATDVDISRLDAAYAALEAAYAKGDLPECVAADVAFHQTIAEASHNMLIGHLTAGLMRVIHGHVSTNLAHLHSRRQHWGQLETQHRAIWQAVRARQPAQAAAAASEHISFVRQHIEESVRDEERRVVALRRQG
ncbi:MAG: FCD domain-containing protein [Burkholderiales bacterium]|nr:FCD domain-containing protein [Burkholderiales bacterium]